MSRIRLSYTERRRRKLALSIAQLERLESRSTVTPFAAFSLATGAFQSFAQLGLMQSNGGGHAPKGSAQADAGAVTPGQSAHGQALGRSGDILPFAIVPKSRPAGGGGGGGTDSPDATAPVKAQAPADDALAAALRSQLPDGVSLIDGDLVALEAGQSSRWRGRLTPRGGSGSGALPIASAMVQGHSPMPSASSAPATPPTIPGLFTGVSPTSPTPSFPAPVITRNAAAGSLNGGAGSKGSIGLPAPVAGTGVYARGRPLAHAVGVLLGPGEPLVDPLQLLGRPGAAVVPLFPALYPRCEQWRRPVPRPVPAGNLGGSAT